MVFTGDKKERQKSRPKYLTSENWWSKPQGKKKVGHNKYLLCLIYLTGLCSTDEEKLGKVGLNIWYDWHRDEINQKKSRSKYLAWLAARSRVHDGVDVTVCWACVWLPGQRDRGGGGGPAATWDFGSADQAAYAEEGGWTDDGHGASFWTSHWSPPPSAVATAAATARGPWTTW